MTKEQLRDILLSVWGAAFSGAVFVFNHLTNQEAWITFATAAAGFLSIAKAIQIFWEIRRTEREDQKTKQAVIDFANKVIDITDAGKELRPPSGVERLKKRQP